VAVPPVTLRCPQCGQYLVAPTPVFAAAAWVACPHCGSPVPVVAPRDPPPLFSWEVFPHLYRASGSPRPPGRALPRLALALLVSGAILLAALGAGAAVAGWTTLAPGTYTVQGVVVQNTSFPGLGAPPIAGAYVNLTGEGPQSLRTVTNVLGQFRFVGVHPGGVTLLVSAAGYYKAKVALFASPTYSTVGANGQNVVVGLLASNGTTNATTTTGPSPVFPDLETFVASDFSAAILLGLGAVVAAAGAWATRRDRHLAIGTAAGSAAVVAPIALFALSLTVVFPAAAWFGGLAIGVGAAAASLEATRMAARGQVPEPE
jgi:ribosomal protein S27E